MCLRELWTLPRSTRAEHSGQVRKAPSNSLYPARLLPLVSLAQPHTAPLSAQVPLGAGASFNARSHVQLGKMRYGGSVGNEKWLVNKKRGLFILDQLTTQTPGPQTVSTLWSVTIT